MSQTYVVHSGRRPVYRVGLTLLELLVVVAIIAAIAGGALFAYGGVEERAQDAQAFRNIGIIDQSTRQFRELEKQLPSNLDTLVWESAVSDRVYDESDSDNKGWPHLWRGTSHTYTQSAGTVDVDDESTADNTINYSYHGMLQTLHPDLRRASRVIMIGEPELRGLYNAGIRQLRYIDSWAVTHDVPGHAGGTTHTNPNHIFDAPEIRNGPGPGGRRAWDFYGKGAVGEIGRWDAAGDWDESEDFSLKLALNETAGLTAIREEVPVLAYVGAGSVLDSLKEAFGLVNEEDGERVVAESAGQNVGRPVLIFGLGPNSSVVRGDNRFMQMTSLPTDTSLPSDVYGNYLMALRITYSHGFSDNNAEFLGVLDPRGRWAGQARASYEGNR